MYVGPTTAKFRLRFSNHKSHLRAPSKMSAAYRDGDDLIYNNFYSHGLQDVSIQHI